MENTDFEWNDVADWTQPTLFKSFANKRNWSRCFPKEADDGPPPNHQTNQTGQPRLRISDWSTVHRPAYSAHLAIKAPRMDNFAGPTRMKRGVDPDSVRSRKLVGRQYPYRIQSTRTSPPRSSSGTVGTSKSQMAEAHNRAGGGTGLTFAPRLNPLAGRNRLPVVRHHLIQGTGSVAKSGLNRRRVDLANRGTPSRWRTGQQFPSRGDSKRPRGRNRIVCHPGRCPAKQRRLLGIGAERVMDLSPKNEAYRKIAT